MDIYLRVTLQQQVTLASEECNPVREPMERLLPLLLLLIHQVMRIYPPTLPVRTEQPSFFLCMLLTYIYTQSDPDRYSCLLAALPHARDNEYSHRITYRFWCVLQSPTLN